MSKNYLLLPLFLLLSLVSCQNDDLPDSEAQTNTLFSVDYKTEKFSSNAKVYLGAYDPDGKLLNYGSLSDSTKWDLKAKYDGNKIDILCFQIYEGSTIVVNHFKNIQVGQLFSEMGITKKAYYESKNKDYNFKIEDFGNTSTNNTASEFVYMGSPYIRRPGFAYWGDFNWNKIENGYALQTFANYYSDDPEYPENGFELILFERGTNTPYIKYLDLTNKSNSELITLNKTDFTKAKTNFVQVNRNGSEFENHFLYTYNSKAGREDIITSFNHISLEGDKTFYINSEEVLPLSYWKFIYNAQNTYTGYSVYSNKPIPSSIDIKQFTGLAATKEGNSVKLTHADVFEGKNLTRSSLGLTKTTNGVACSYVFNFDKAESSGSTTLTPFKIPEAILNTIPNAVNTDAINWKIFGYSQNYTDVPNNAVLDYLKYDLLLSVTNNKASSGEYYYENFNKKFE